MRGLMCLMVAVAVLNLFATDASAANKKQCAKSAGATVYYGARSAAGYGTGAYQIYRGGPGNVGIAQGGSYWNKMKGSARDTKKNCFPGRR